jgi:DNA-binding SARP family transcriptional activator
MDARCRIELFGELRVRSGDRVVTRFSTYKTGALLAYLAYHRERRTPREVLAALLWPDSAPAAGRKSLNQALSSLRRQLSPAGAVIAADRLTVGLHPDAVTTDVAEFQAALQAAVWAGSVTERVQRLTEAVDLYRGELLPGYYEEWVLTEQRRLAECYFQAVGELTDALAPAGEWDRAVGYARRAVGLDPLREEAHHDLIRLLAAAGQPTEALRQYQE